MLTVNTMTDKSLADWRKEFVKELDDSFRRDQLGTFLRATWVQYLPDLISGGAHPIKLKYDFERIENLLLEPIEAFIAGTFDPDDKFAALKANDVPNFLCNKSFGHGEPTYSCRDCAVDQTCVLCMDCFKQSPHKNHRYKISSSSGGGYCDCGDPEAWKKDFACAAHQPPAGTDVNIDLEHARKRLSPDTLARFSKVVECALCYIYQFFTTTENALTLPDDVIQRGSGAEGSEFVYVTILYNDETHTYDQVINTLTRTLECTQDEALEYATVVDHDGRTPIKFGSATDCDRVKSFVERNSRRPQPLRLEVVLTTIYLHQVFALRVLGWIRKLAETCEGFKAVTCDVCLRKSDATNDLSIVSALLMHDSRMWKAARSSCHSLFMSTFLSFGDAKVEFARLFARLYPNLMTEFIADDHDHGDSCTGMSVQIFTVPSVARILFSDKLVEIIIKSFVLVLQTRRDEAGRLSFDRTTQQAGTNNLKRALYILYDSRYLLNTIPTPTQWTDSLRKGFIGAFDQFLDIMNMMESMDSHVRRTQSHVEYESDWEQPFNIQLRMGPIISQLQNWCAADDKVLVAVFERLLYSSLNALGTVDKLEKKEAVAGRMTDCIDYDVSVQAVSIHHPVIRMLAGVAAQALWRGLVLPASTSRLIKQNVHDCLKSSAREIAEFPLRTMVLLAQANCGMWRRNGYALANQIFFYQQPRCREEMLDKDVLLLQVCAAVMKPNEFYIHALNKFGLISWANEVFDASPVRAEDDSIRQVIFLAEEFLYFLIVLIGERYNPVVGQVTEDDCLENELIHQLCMSTMSYSELVKSMPDQESQSTNLEEIVRKVAVFKRPSSTAKGFFELKPEYSTRYNMFFYHFTRTEHSKAEDTQRKRKKKDGEDVFFPPPCPPQLSPAFAGLARLLDCDIFMHLVGLTLRRALDQHPRSFSEGQLNRVLYLVGYALHEEKRNRQLGGPTDFKFVEKAVDVGIFNVMRHLINQKDNEAYKAVAQWTLKLADSLMGSMDQAQPERGSDRASEVSTEEVEDRRRMAAARRERIMQQMRQAQTSFATQNVEELGDIMLPENDSRMVVSVASISRPIAVGPGQSLSSVVVDDEKRTCILCSESHTISLSSEPFVAVAYVQRSTVLSQDNRAVVNAKLQASAPTTVNAICTKLMPTPLALHAKLPEVVHVSSCGHLLHAKCWKAYFDSVVARERRRSIRLRTNSGSFDITKNEFRCPLCSRLCNAAVPLFHLFVPKELSIQPELSFDNWLEALQKLMEFPAYQEGSTLDMFERLVVHIANVENAPPIQKLRAVVENIDRLNGIDVNKSEQFSEAYVEALRTFQHQTHQVAYNAVTTPSTEEECAAVNWATCSYTIQNTEMVLRHEKKPLLGSFTSRQQICLNSLIRSACWTSSVYEPKVMLENAVRTYALIFRPEELLENGQSVVDMDSFTVLLHCLSLFPWLPWDEGTILHFAMDSSSYRPPTGDLIDRHILRLVYVIHMVQIMLHLTTTDTPETEVPNDDVDADPVLCQLFAEIQRRSGGVGQPGAPAAGDITVPKNLQGRIRKAVWPFLSSTAIFVYFMTGIEGPESSSQHCDSASEQYEDLMQYLGLPTTFTEIFDSSPVLQNLIKRLLDRHLPSLPSNHLTFPRPMPSFVSLPHDYIDVITQAARFRSCRVEVDDRRSPALCLVCGEMLCSQSLCCQYKLDNMTVGACTFHSMTCGGGTGIFLRIRENQILFLHGTNKGSFTASPYVDAYGEPDAFLRRGNPLHLSEERLEQMLRHYVHHDIADEISHAMDQNGSLAGFDWHHF